MLDEVQEVAGCDGHDVAAALDDLVVALVQRLVDVHHRVHDSLSVHGGNIFTKKKKIIIATKTFNVIKSGRTSII